MFYKFINIRKNYPSWRFECKFGVYRYDPIFEIESSDILSYLIRNTAPEQIVRVVMA